MKKALKWVLLERWTKCPRWIIPPFEFSPPLIVFNAFFFDAEFRVLKRFWRFVVLVRSHKATYSTFARVLGGHVQPIVFFPDYGFNSVIQTPSQFHAYTDLSPIEICEIRGGMSDSQIFNSPLTSFTLDEPTRNIRKPPRSANPSRGIASHEVFVCPSRLSGGGGHSDLGVLAGVGVDAVVGAGAKGAGVGTTHVSSAMGAGAVVAGAGAQLVIAKTRMAIPIAQTTAQKRFLAIHFLRFISSPP